MTQEEGSGTNRTLSNAGPNGLWSRLANVKVVSAPVAVNVNDVAGKRFAGHRTRSSGDNCAARAIVHGKSADFWCRASHPRIWAKSNEIPHLRSEPALE